MSCLMAEKRGGRGTRIIGECWHNETRRDIMIIIATCPQWCRSKIKWDAERTQSAGWRCVLRAKTVHCRCSLRSLFCIKTGMGWNSTYLHKMQTAPEGKMGTDWRSENDVCWGLTNISLSIILSNHSFKTFLRYGWMDKLFINPIWEIAVFEKSQPLFSIPKQTCKMKPETDHALTHCSLCLKHRWKKTCWFLQRQVYCFPADLAPYSMRHTSSLGWLTKTPYINHDSSI